MNGLNDNNIVLMLADDHAVNTRNRFKNFLLPNGQAAVSLYDDSIEIDFRGEDVTVQNFVRALQGRHSSRHALQTDENSNILIYLTGHGGDSFFKFQDIEEVTSEEIARAIGDMRNHKLYNQILLLADTCQAFTLGDAITAPNVLVVGSSLRGESSYAHHSDYQIGLSVIERYTFSFMEFVKKNGVNLPIKEAMVDPHSFLQQRAHVGFRDDLILRNVSSILLSEFFANNEHAQSQARLERESQRIRLPSTNYLSASQTSMSARRHIPHCAYQWTGQNSIPRQWNGVLHQSLPVAHNPSDGIFLCLVASILGLLAFVARRG